MQLNLDQSVGKDARCFDSRQTFATPTRSRATRKPLGSLHSESSPRSLLSDARSKRGRMSSYNTMLCNAVLRDCTHWFIRYFRLDVTSSDFFRSTLGRSNRASAPDFAADSDARPYQTRARLVASLRPDVPLEPPRQSVAPGNHIIIERERVDQAASRHQPRLPHGQAALNLLSGTHFRGDSSLPGQPRPPIPMLFFRNIRVPNHPVPKTRTLAMIPFSVFLERDGQNPPSRPADPKSQARSCPKTHADRLQPSRIGDTLYPVKQVLFGDLSRRTTRR